MTYHRCVSVVLLLVSLTCAEDRTGFSSLGQLVGLPQQPQLQQLQQSPQQLQYGLPPDNWPAVQEEPAPQGFTVQSGYSGLVVPEAGGELSTLHKLGGVALGASLLAHLLPFPFNHIALFLGSKVGLWVVGIATLLLLGGAATTALCALTPICTISFLGFGLTRESTRAFLTRDRLDAAARFVRQAVHKWGELQKRAEQEDEASKREARKRKKAARGLEPAATATTEAAPAADVTTGSS